MNFKIHQLFCFLLVLLLTQESIAQAPVPGPCPDIKVQRNFNDTRFAGRWFEYARTERKEEDNLKCIFFEYIPPVDTRFILNRRAVSTITDEEEFRTRQGTVLSPGQAISPDFYLYSVVSTDYSNYAVLHSCKNQEMTSNHLEVFWILTRKRFPGPYSTGRALSDAFMRGLPINKLRLTDQINCPSPSKDSLPTNL